METLTINHICGYLPFGLKCEVEIKYSTTARKFAADLIGIDNFSSGVQYLVKPYDVSGNAWDQNVMIKSFKPLLIPLSALAKEQWIEVFRAGIVSLKVPYPALSYELKIIEWHDNAVEILLNSTPDTIAFDFVEMQFSTDCRFNQLAAFAKLFELHADVHSLIEKGLALNKLRYER